MKLSFFIFLLVFISLSTNSCVYTRAADSDSVYYTYVPPPWAPPYDDVSSVRYYYLPDYEIYYDVWQHQFCYYDGAAWLFSPGLPPCCPNVDLNRVFVVLIHRDEDRPWLSHDWYRDNYPRGMHEQYRRIVAEQHVIPDVQPKHEVVARAFNENNDRVTFMQHPVEEPAQAHAQPPSAPPQYHHIVHEVPLRVIAPSMPVASRGLNYGSGYHPSPHKSTPPGAASGGQKKGK